MTGILSIVRRSRIKIIGYRTFKNRVNLNLRGFTMFISLFNEQRASLDSLLLLIRVDGLFLSKSTINFSSMGMIIQKSNTTHKMSFINYNTVNSLILIKTHSIELLNFKLQRDDAKKRKILFFQVKDLFL